MKYTCEIEINKPVEEVVELFDSVDNLYKWMEGLEKFEPLEGTPGQPGARSKLHFKMGKREIEMIETITSKNLPEEFSGTYEAKGVYNIINNSFIPAGENKTRYVSKQEFQMKGALKLMAWLMPGMFKKQTMKHMKAFKRFAESN